MWALLLVCGILVTCSPVPSTRLKNSRGYAQISALKQYNDPDPVPFWGLGPFEKSVKNPLINPTNVMNWLSFHVFSLLFFFFFFWTLAVRDAHAK